MKLRHTRHTSMTEGLRYNNHKSLSGIETFSSVVSSVRGIQIIVIITINPYQGLKLAYIPHEMKEYLGYNNHKSLSGIETTIF